ncbi:hypothetical protein Scep_025922 [Stephania cephalantha]|uniref:Uncharacterized protein n=1 Tax=Stephania cephalantha TaxID=152367 RepID=A0AAP0HMR2_9MAGN
MHPVRNDSEDVYHFGSRLRPDIGFYVITSGARTLGEIYERALSHKTYYLRKVADGTPLGQALTLEQVT